MWLIEDEAHAELQRGEFESREEAMNELRRRAYLSWDTAPNLAPCISWRTCGRRYQLIESDGSKAISTELALEISAAGVQWHTS